jgi:hypothetical protein
MKATQIRPGVVYAYGAGLYDDYDAVVIVDNEYGAGRDHGGDTKYLAIRVPHRGVTDEVIKLLGDQDAGAGPAAVRMLSKAGMYADEVSHRLVRGPWVEVMAERDRRRQAIAQRAAAAQAIRDEELARTAERHAPTLYAFGRHGIALMVDDNGDYCMDQETADKLIERLQENR